MPIALSHSDPDKKKRKASKLFNPQKGCTISHKDEYQRTENILDEMYCDVANGLMESEIKKKLLNGLYNAQGGTPMKQRNAFDYIEAVKKRIAADYADKSKNIRETLMLNYMTIYQDALEKGDRYNAKGALDSIARLTGANQDKPRTAVQINNSDSGITINFGFLNDKKDVEDKDE